jgi:hypothetical protein
VAELIFLILTFVPRTAFLGAVLFTALFGGAMVSHIRLNEPLFTHICSALIWVCPVGAGCGCAIRRCGSSSRSSGAASWKTPFPQRRTLALLGLQPFFAGFIIADTIASWRIGKWWKTYAHLGFGPEVGVQISIMELFSLSCTWSRAPLSWVRFCSWACWAGSWPVMCGWAIPCITHNWRAFILASPCG